MTELIQVLLLTTLAGAAIPVGGLIAMIERISPEWLENEFRHSVIAFGGGVLVSAVALVLVPDGIKELSLPWIVTAFVLGGLLFWGLETLLAQMKGSMSQLIAMLSDFIPEAIALGAAFATGESAGLLLAVLIGLQNLPEGFNAFRELEASSKIPRKKIVAYLAACVPLGPLSGWLGFQYLSNYPRAVDFIMLLAASGILYLTFQDLAPQAKTDNQRAPAIGAVFGFLLGLIGHVLLN
ncbi:divalent cation transporter [Rhodopirellula sp. JC740]|uniref:Divalent cation transporter n=1 Tax=Rhodopirellula halodulae TaxID=2894198 RepID=A0ABS8NGY2_9BACT|nr:divalent cation transporter [Rhodopirellula sp. JC740]MCC9642790.1 divalent cation transporter [Rhodopirellula sp. JC740]